MSVAYLQEQESKFSNKCKHIKSNFRRNPVRKTKMISGSIYLFQVLSSSKMATETWVDDQNNENQAKFTLHGHQFAHLCFPECLDFYLDCNIYSRLCYLYGLLILD